MESANNMHTTWPMLVVAVTLVIGLVGAVWSRVVDGQKEQKSDVAQIYARLLKEAEHRHTLELNLAQNYARTDALRQTIDASLEPVKLQLAHVVDRVDEMRTDFHEYKQENRT